MENHTNIQKSEIDLKEGKRFIFVGGPARSGTTLVQNILDSHPDICGAPEFHHLPDLIALKKKLYRSINKGRIDLICSHKDVDAVLRTIIENLLYPLADKTGCFYLSEKTPKNILIFSELMNLYPKARFIYVARDPRAIVSSMLQVGIRGRKIGLKTDDFTHSVRAAIMHIKQCLSSAVSALKKAPDRFIFLVYERLVTDPESETRKLCLFLNLKWSERMLHPGSVKHLGEKAITNNVWYDSNSYNRGPVPHEVDKWKRQLSFVQKALITSAFSENKDLARFGYEFSRKDIPIASRVTGTVLIYCLSALGFVTNRITPKIKRLKGTLLGF